MADPAGLTAALLGPLPPVSPAALRRAVEPISAELVALAGRRPGGGPWRLTDHDVRLALAPGAPMAVPSFTWSSRTARRGLGLAAVRALVGGTATSPEEGVRAAIAGSLRAVRQGAGPVASMDHWLAALPAAGRAAVGAEAITWATRLWCALDWTAFEAPPLIGRDLWWDSPGAPVLGLRSRAEVRAGTSRLVVLGGARRSTVRAELSVVALVEALRAGASVVPGRVMGWWPDSGHHVRVDLDQAVLEEGVAVVARIVQRGLVGAAV